MKLYSCRNRLASTERGHHALPIKVKHLCHQSSTLLYSAQSCSMSSVGSIVLAAAVLCPKPCFCWLYPAGWALAVVSSRAFRVSGPHAPAALLPLIDMANHSFQPNCEVLPVPGGVAMVAKRPVSRMCCPHAVYDSSAIQGVAGGASHDAVSHQLLVCASVRERDHVLKPPTCNCNAPPPSVESLSP